MCVPVFVINYGSSMFLTTKKTFKFTFTVACPGNIWVVYIIMNKRKMWFAYYISWFIENVYAFKHFTAYHIDVLFPGQIFINMYILNKKVGKVCGSNCFFERGWNNNHLILSTFGDILFDVNHVETFASSTFILSKYVSMFLWNRNKFVLSANSFIKGFEALNRSFT